MRDFFYYFFFLFLLSCGTHNNKIVNNENWIDLQNFTVVKPINWRSVEDHGYISYTPIKKNDNFYYNKVSVFQYKLKEKPLSLKEFSLNQIKSANKALNFNYQKTSLIEKSRLGDVYLHEAEHVWNGKKYKKSSIYFKHKNEYYFFSYSSIKELYETHFKEAMSILYSIKFK